MLCQQLGWIVGSLFSNHLQRSAGKDIRSLMDVNANQLRQTFHFMCMYHV